MKYYGIYTKNAAKALKLERVTVQTVDRDIYICTGYVLFKCTMEDYDAIFRPVLKRDPGYWTIDGTGTREGGPDLPGIFEKFAAANDGQEIQETPVHFAKSGKEAVAFWSGTFATLFNPVFSGSFTGCQFFASGPRSGAVVKCAGVPVGIVMPVNISEAETRAVRAFVGEEAATVAA